jgi:ribosomal peptide maturation radical SAM protein 1
MPWAIFNRPSIQLAGLKAYIRQARPGTVVQTSHPYLSAAREIGMDPYRIISENPWAAEALYCALLFPDRRRQAEYVFRRSLDAGSFRSLPDFDLLTARLDSHLDSWLASLDTDAEDCLLIGLTVCFSQLPASLLTARRIKKISPELPVVLGGSTCSPQIGRSLLETFPEIDYVISGEGEGPLLELTRYLAGEAEYPGANVQAGRPAAASRRENRLHPTRDNEIKDINTLPLPDFDDYFRELLHAGLSFIPSLPLEFSRGCWWNRCTFCNLNLQWCGYRGKTGGRMQREAEALAGRYRVLDFAFTDNSLPPAEADAFFNAMAESEKSLRFFGEVRAPKDPAAYSLYHAGGLRSIQVGIEAFSDSLLRRMRKGVSALENVAAMKYAMEAGIKLDGNLILEFPGSTEEEVAETCRVLDYVLPYRPLKAARFFLGHGSPVWQDPAGFGIKAITSHPFNRRLYPEKLLAGLEMLILSYRGDMTAQRKKWRPVRARVNRWHDFHAGRKTDRPPLSFRRGGDFILIRQETPGGNTLHHRLHGASAKIYLACRTPAASEDLQATFPGIAGQRLHAFLEDLSGKRLLFRAGEMSLALAVEER